MGLYVNITYYYIWGKEMKGNKMDIYPLIKNIEIIHHISISKKDVYYPDFKNSEYELMEGVN